MLCCKFNYFIGTIKEKADKKIFLSLTLQCRKTSMTAGHAHYIEIL